MKLYIITVATHYDGYLKYLEKSCKKYNHDLIILGLDEKWKGFNWRYKLILNFLNTLNNNDIVCIIDGFDVICCRDLNELTKVYNNLKKKYNFKIIVAEHKYVDNSKYKIQTFISSYYFSKCDNKFINAGTYIGNVNDLKKILNDVYNLNPYNNSDDQKLLTKYCKNNKNIMHIDINNELFLTLENSYQEIDELIIFNNNIQFNNNFPFFIHGPGYTFLDNIIIKLNYDYNYENKVKDKLLNNYYNNILFRLKNNRMFLTFIVILFFIIIFLYFFTKHKSKRKYKK